MNAEPLARKIEFVLDILFSAFGAKRKEVVVEEVDVSDEDVDY
jgi:hypothetical protein